MFYTPSVTLLCVARPLAYTENDEFSRLDRRNADFHDHLPNIAGFRRIGFFVALDVESLIRCQTEQRTAAPDHCEEGRHITADTSPEEGIVRLEDDPLRAVFEAVLDHAEQAAHVDIAPSR